MRQHRFFQQLIRILPDMISLLCAGFMLCAVPLLFRNAFFDINRFKVEVVCHVMPILALIMGIAALVRMKKDGGVQRRLTGAVPCGIMLVFLIACILSCVFAGFEKAVLDGSEGRYCGLYFMLCCGAAFFVIGEGRMNDRLLVPLMLCAAGVGALGVANAIGFDPLGFYARIKKGQEQVYLSTIGHFDFFGTYLIMLFPIAAAQFVFSRHRGMRSLGFVCALIMAMGAMASRTDSALAGLHLGCFMLAAISGGSYSRMARALLVWALCWLSMPVMFGLLAHSPYHPDVSGLPRMLWNAHVGEALCAAFLAAAVWCAVSARKGKSAPDRKRMAAILFGLFALAAAALFAAIIYFSVWNTTAELGSAASFLRFDDRWGSLRGFAWIRSLRAFSDYDLLHKLFGNGMELTLRVLRPYFDDPAMLVGGVFNDPHCQPLQMLLTCGLLGMIAFMLFYLSMFAVVARHAGDDPLLCGMLGMLLGYFVVLMINVTQPILIATYFALCGLGVSALRGRMEGGNRG